MKLRHLVPFGLAEPNKPRHYREMAKVVWENRRALPYASRILRKGVCDGCSLGPYGLRDNVIPGVHLCTTRLKLLRLNTMAPLDPARLADGQPDVAGVWNSFEATHTPLQLPASLADRDSFSAEELQALVRARTARGGDGSSR